MKRFLDDNFLLQNKPAQELYHTVAKHLPIIDYHNHLSPELMAKNIRFENLTAAWLNGDHYKWRAMRTNGIEESYITGHRTDPEKFEAWAATVPYTLRNPLYHWTHLELQRYFGITEILNPASAAAVYKKASAALQTNAYSVRGLLERMQVEILCTTDDPVDNLSFHRQLQEENWNVNVFPAFRPDKAMQTDDPVRFNNYVAALEAAADHSIGSYSDYLSALKKRHDYFAAHQCVISDHGLEALVAEPYTAHELETAFGKLRSGKELSLAEQQQLRSALLVSFAEWDWEKGFVQQFHLGALRNNNGRMLQELGPDTGWDSIGDWPQAKALSTFLDRLDRNNTLAKTILYNLNPADNEVFATMTGNFNDGSMAGKIQWGSGWWFLDQKDGMTRQLNTLSNMGLLSRFVGMLTDSRSFLSFPRHEYFRRILCNLLGEDIVNGELPDDLEWTGKIVADICYHNARNFFNWKGV